MHGLIALVNDLLYSGILLRIALEMIFAGLGAEMIRSAVMNDRVLYSANRYFHSTDHVEYGFRLSRFYVEAKFIKQ